MLDLPLTRHAACRCHTRGISFAAIEAALLYGRHRHARGADVYVLGWREIRQWARSGVDITRWHGVQVVCANGGQVLTVYRNKNPRALRDRPARHAA